MDGRGDKNATGPSNVPPGDIVHYWIFFFRNRLDQLGQRIPFPSGSRRV